MQLATRKSVLNMDLEREIEFLEKSYGCQKEDFQKEERERSVLNARFWRIYRQFSTSGADGYGGRWHLVFRFAKLAHQYREYDVAQQYFTTAIEMIPEYENRYICSAYESLGYILLEKKAYDEAIAHFMKCLELQEAGHKSAAIWNGMAYAHFGRNRFAEAIQCAEKAIEQSQDAGISESSCFLLAFCSGVRKDLKREKRYTNRLLRLGPDNPNLDYLV